MQVNDIIIEWTEIPDGARGTRRQRERAAVADLIQRMVPGATLEHGEDGAPIIDGWHISITHSMRLAVVAICKSHAIGIDAEEWRDALAKVKDKYQSESEKAWASPADYLHLWTAKEAVFKAALTPGLPFTDISVSRDKSQASVADAIFSLTYFKIGQTLLCVASPKGSETKVTE